MSKQIDFGEWRNPQTRNSHEKTDSLGIASLLLRYRIVQTQHAAVQTSKTIMLAIVFVSVLVMLMLWLFDSNTDTVPEEAYFDPTVHNTDDELHDAGSGAQPAEVSLYFYSYDPAHWDDQCDGDSGNNRFVAAVFGFNYSETGIDDRQTYSGTNTRLHDAAYNRVLNQPNLPSL